MKQLKLAELPLSVSWPAGIQAKQAPEPPIKKRSRLLQAALTDSLWEGKISSHLHALSLDLPPRKHSNGTAGGWPNRDLVGKFPDTPQIVGKSLGTRHYRTGCISK